jgi:hypothetical protein
VSLRNETALDWHRPGAFCIAGPGIQHDELVYGATLLDVVPTVLALFGLPAAEDMPGRVLAEVFEQPPPCHRIASWESVPGECGMHPVEDQAGGPAPADALQQLAALGYVDFPAQASRKAQRVARTHQRFNLARVYPSQGKPTEALPLLEELTQTEPENLTFQVYLAQCYYQTGRLEDCRPVARAVVGRNPGGPAAQLIEANLCLAENRTAEALERLLAAEKSAPLSPAIRHLMGRLYLDLSRWEDAERTFRELLEVDPEHAEAQVGLAQALAGPWNRPRKPPPTPWLCASICRRRISRWAWPWPGCGAGIAPFWPSKPA